MAEPNSLLVQKVKMPREPTEAQNIIAIRILLIKVEEPFSDEEIKSKAQLLFLALSPIDRKVLAKLKELLPEN